MKKILDIDRFVEEEKRRQKLREEESKIDLLMVALACILIVISVIAIKLLW